jgi:hypothetical protein
LTRKKEGRQTKRRKVKAFWSITRSMLEIHPADEVADISGMHLGGCS